jgi:uncharacterized repeat protein (TIGR01451 family)
VAIAAILAIIAVPAALATPPANYVLSFDSGSYVGNNPAHHVKAYFPAAGLRMVPQGSSPAWEFGLSWSGYGPQGAVAPVGAATVVALDNRATYTRSGAPTEWFINTPAGVEHWIALEAAPAAGPVVLEFAVSGGLMGPQAHEVGTISTDGGVILYTNGSAAIGYNMSAVVGATGNVVPTTLTAVTDAQGTVTGLNVVVTATPEDYPLNVGFVAGSPKFLASTERVQIGGGSDVPPGLPQAASANDTCAGAQIIPPGPFPVLTTTVNIAENTDAGDPPVPACAAAGNAAYGAAWYSFTPTISNTYFFNDCFTQAPGTTHQDTIIAIYSSSDNTCAGTLTALPGGACSDDASACPGPPSRPFLSNAAGFMTAGQTYFILVWNWEPWDPSIGDVQIQVTASSAPANDTCAGAAALTLNRTKRSTLLSAANDYSLSATTCFTGIGNNPIGGTCLGVGRDVVFSFTATDAGLYSFRARNDGTSAGANQSLYVTSSCPAPGAIACPAGVLGASNKNPFASNFPGREEVSCLPLTAGQTVFAIVDECSLSASGGPITVEVAPCFPEVEPNDTPLTASSAPYAGVSPVTGSIGTAIDVDFFSLGAPPAGSRVFAAADANSSYSSAAPNPAPFTGDFDMRITTLTDTLEFDARDTDAENGAESGAVAGRRLTGAPSFIRINNPTGVAGEPYVLHSTVQPPGDDAYGSSASAEVNEGTNDDFPGAETAGNLFFAGTLFNSADIDFFKICAGTGDILMLQVDNDPTRTDVTPGRTLLTAFSAVTGGQIGPFSGFNAGNIQVSNTTSGAGSLTATTPFSPSEVWTWRAEYSGPHFGYVDMRAAPSFVNGQDYLLSVTINGQNGSEMSSDIQLTKTGPDTANAGDVIVYDITLTNNGPNIATAANFFDQLPDGTAFAGYGLDGVDDLFGECSAPPPGDVGGSVSCTFDCLPVGRTVTIQIAVQVFPCIGDGFQIFNQIFAGTVTTMTPESVTFASWTTTITDDGTCEADGNLCTTDACDSGVCVQGGEVDPNDNNPCTDDSCDPDTGVHNDPNTASCDDGNACTSGDVCAEGACVSGGAVDPNDNNACTDDSCDPGTGVHNDPNTNPCDDGNACTSGDACGGGSCQPGAAVDPNDNNACTDDSCDPGTGVHNDPNTAPCDDGNVCSTGDTCGGGSCQPGSGTLNCDDGNPCTDDFCAAGCQHTNNTDPCDDGDAGTTNDTCSGGVCAGVSACTPGGKTKTTGYYHSLCNGPHSGDSLTAADAACVAALGGTFASVTSVADICAELHTTGSDKCEKAEEDLMATALNICKGKVCATQTIDSSCSSYTTVGESYAAADAALSNPGRTTATCDGADCQAKEINNGKALEANSLAITHVAGEIRLDWEAPLVDNPNQIQGYKVWRRAVGSLAPFTQIGSTVNPHFVDPTGQTGNFEYEIVAY